MEIFRPQIYQKNIFQINYQKLKELGYQILIFDLDNTIGSIKETTCKKETLNFLQDLKQDFQVIISSNSAPKRVFKFFEKQDLEIYAYSLKPTLRVLRKIKKKHQVPYSKMVMIGDQILTDIFMGNRCGLLTILVDPIKNIDFKITNLNRKIEKIINKKNGIKRGNYYEKN